MPAQLRSGARLCTQHLRLSLYQKRDPLLWGRSQIQLFTGCLAPLFLSGILFSSINFLFQSVNSSDFSFSFLHDSTLLHSSQSIFSLLVFNVFNKSHSVHGPFIDGGQHRTYNSKSVSNSREALFISAKKSLDQARPPALVDNNR